MTNDTPALVVCAKLPDGCLLPLRPFIPLTPEEESQLVPGEPIFINVDRIEGLGGEVVMAKITPP